MRASLLSLALLVLAVPAADGGKGEKYPRPKLLIEVSDFLKQEDRLKDTPEGLHQHVREIETYIRLYIQEYPVPPDQLTQRAVNYYNDGALISVRSRINNAYRRFYAECYE